MSRSGNKSPPPILGFARWRWRRNTGAHHRRRLFYQQPSRTLAAGSNQPDSARARRALGRMQTVRDKVDDASSAAPPPPALTSAKYATAYNEAKNFGGDGITTPTQRTPEQTFIGTFWAYDGTPSLCAPPRLYNQITVHIADQTKLRPIELARLLGAGQCGHGRHRHRASGNPNIHYDFWRPITAIRESDPGTGPTGAGDGNDATVGDPDLHSARRAGQQSERAELYSALPRLSFGPRRIRRRDFRNAAPFLRNG